MTLTDPTFDAFEQRLAATLTARADTISGPGDGLDRIHTRVTHRRRVRRTAWLAAAAALVLVAGTVGIALRTTTHDSAPYVDDTTETTLSSPSELAPVDDRPLIPTPTQPAWLAPPGPPSALLMPSFRRGTGFSFSLSQPLGDSAVDYSITVNVNQKDLTQRLGPWTDVSIGGRPGLMGESDGNPTVLFELGDGFVATLSAVPPSGKGVPAAPPYDEVLPALVQLAEQLEVRGADYWVPILDQRDAAGAENGWPGYRLGLEGTDGRSYIGRIDGSSVHSELTVPGTPDGTYMLRTNALAAQAPQATEEPQANQMPPGTPIRVRGHDGVLGAQKDNSDTIRRMLAWKEGGYQFRLYFSDAVTLDDALAVADRLQPLDEVSWAGALFPEQVPTTLTQFMWMWAIPEASPS
jgi:hypothetical protein